MKRKFTFFIIILTVLLGIGGYWYSQKNIFSKEVLKLEILGPETADLGQEVEYIVRYKNNGNINLEEPKLVFKYPDYSVLEDGKSLRQEIGSQELGDIIYPGQEKTISFKARIMGKEGEAKIAEATLTYRPKNLNAWYESQTTLTTIIKTIPVTFGFDDLPSKIDPEKEITFKLNYYSYLDFPISGLRIKISYPSGFEFKNSNPKALDQKEWDIGVLNKGKGGRVEITGTIKGTIGEQKIFKAEMGRLQNGEFILLKEEQQGLELVESDLYIIQQINGNPKYTATPGELLHYEIFFKNLGKDPLSNLFMVVKLEGQLYDFETIKSLTGDFTTGDNSIVFDWRKNSKLKFLDAQEEGKMEFWIELKKDFDMSVVSSDKNPVIINEVFLSQAREQFETKVNSKIEVSQRGFFEDEIFGNSGPIPPKVGEVTTYTINWSVKNYFSQVKNVKVKANLPQGVELTGKVFPGDLSQKIAFDPYSREIVWDLGDLEPGTGISNPAPNVNFQISSRPNQNQVGNPIILIDKVRISGEDQWSDQNVEAFDDAIDSTLPDDPSMSREKGIVQ